MRHPSAPCAPFRNIYNLLPLFHRIAIHYGYRLPALFLGQRLGVNEGLSPAHDTSTDSERFVLRARSLDEEPAETLSPFFPTNTKWFPFNMLSLVSFGSHVLIVVSAGARSEAKPGRNLLSDGRENVCSNARGDS